MMSSKKCSRIALLGSPAAMAILLIVAMSAEAKEKKPAAPASDEAAIRAAVDAYTAAYNRGDAKAVAACWSDTGEWIAPSGERYTGRQAIEKELQKLFQEEKGVKLEVLQVSVRVVSPDVAIEEGTVRVTEPNQPASDSTYMAVHVKKNGQWKLEAVRETELPEETASSSPLQDLAWLVGEWTDTSPDTNVAATITWTKNKTFLNYSFKVEAPDMDDLEGTQVIGWDPAAGTIRSWMFDSDGGFGEGTWTKKDNSWVVKFSQVMPDGRKASATNIYTKIDDNTLTWKSIARKVDGEFLPNVEEVKIVRKGTGPAAKAAAKPRKTEAKK